MEFIIKFAQTHETFRVAEIESLAVVEKLDLKIIEYDADSPICVVQLLSVEAAKRLIKRSILAQSIHELWGQGLTLDELHESVKKNTPHLWPQYKMACFKFDVDAYRGAHTSKGRLGIINTFAYLPFEGPISLSRPDEVFTVFEQWKHNSVPLGVEFPDKVWMGRFLADSARDLVLRYDLKKRDYISTTSMDSELALITANISLAAPGKMFYDPFAGTGSFPVACAHFGAMTWGSDIDGRSMRGDGGKKSLYGNFEQYGLRARFGDVFTCDMTNSPMRRVPMWDGIVADPPYGVREGLRVLGLKDPEKTPWLIEAGIKKGKDPDYVPPKKPYSFLAMLDDILVFASDTLVENGRVSFWMPTANDEDQEIPMPTHPCLERVSVCVQAFYKWSRRLITYRRIPDREVSQAALEAYAARQKVVNTGTSADDLNPFRNGYFKGFKTDE